MTDGVQRELMSALLDDEASELEVRRVLRDLDADGFAAGVTEQLDNRQSTSPAWLARMGRVAVAASVAAATVVGWQYYGGSTESAAPAAVVASQETRLNAPVGETALVSGGNSGEDKASVEASRHLEGMVLRHNDMSARHSGQGVTPYARLISQQAQHGSR